MNAIDESGPFFLRAVHEVVRAAHGAHDSDELLRRMCACVAETLGFERVVISRYRPDAEEREPVAAFGVDLDEIRALPRALAEWPFVRRSLDERRPVYVADAGGEAAMPPGAAETLGVRSVLALPLVAGGRCLGFLTADRGGGVFEPTPDELQLLETVVVLAAAFLERAMAHDELVRLDELKRNFVALASHELRTPASVVSGIAATLHLRGHELRDDQLVALQVALYEQSERMRGLVDQLLDLSRLEARSIRIARERLPVRRRIEELVLLVAQERRGEVRVDVPPDLEALVDPVALDRVVSNLLANALRYGRAPITVAAEQRDRHFRLTVEDRGDGVSPEFVPRLFERFSRAAHDALAPDGAGLGLSIAQSYAQAHGGELLYRRAERGGARFELVVPSDPGDA